MNAVEPINTILSGRGVDELRVLVRCCLACMSDITSSFGWRSADGDASPRCWVNSRGHSTFPVDATDMSVRASRSAALNSKIVGEGP